MTDQTTVYQWEVYCLEDNHYETTWGTEMPTSCPTNPAHAISTNPGPRIIQTVSDNLVKIREEDKFATQGIYQFRCYNVEIPAGEPGNIVSYEMVWPRPITIMTGWFYSTNDNVGDIINANVTATIGALVAPLYANASTVTTTSTVFDHLYEGYSVHVTDLANFDSLGEALEIDLGNNTVLCEKPSSHTYSPLSPTYVQMTSRVIREMYIPVANQRYAFAEKKIGGRSLPSGVPLTMNYANNDGNVKLFTFYIEYLY